MSENPPPIPSKLFRQEVFIARQDAWLGELVLSKPVSHALLALGFAVLALSLLAYLVWGEYTRKIRASGTIVPNTGVIKVTPAQAGIVVRLAVHEGQNVAEGEVLAVLNSERTTATGGASAEVEKQLNLRRASLQQDALKIQDLYAQQDKALTVRLANLHTELAQVDAALVLQQKRLALSEQMLVNQRKLFAEKFLSEMALQQKEQDGLAELATLEAIRRSRTSLQRDVGTSEADLATLPDKQANELAAVQRNLASLAQDGIENESRRELLLKAPQAGVVTAILTDVGKLVGAGQPVLNLIPAGSELQADVYLPARAAGFVRVGSQALLQFQAFPYQKFGSQAAQVVKLSRVAVVGSDLPYPPANAPGELYYIASLSLPKKTVTAYGHEEPLQSGMGFDANLVLDTRTLLEWVFEPVFSISGNLL
ncbi:HlyD family efflux transporter periplasmic adaptor subunit [Rhodoferax sp.]|uniref:HlyD family secretion protein n=1 Tax=Rhodoferax sp. TaxID=50421 RepID=UPI0025CFF776|nr:HlyD family efflux transporter periplasmic adaptor subunit [Rhodoferax sp.]